MDAAEAPVQHPTGGVAEFGRVGEDLLRVGIRLEGLALDDADSGQLAGEFDVVAGGRLLLHVLVDHLEEGVSRSAGSY